MKRFLSWLALIGCYVLFCVVVQLDTLLIGYMLNLYHELSPFLKLVILIIGGSFTLGLTLAPIYYGAILTVAWCENIYPSKKGARYTALGILIVVCCVLEAIYDFSIRDVIIGIYGIVLIFHGRNIKKEYKDNMQQEIHE